MHVAQHFRRLAEQHIERHVDRVIVELSIGDTQMSARCRRAHNRERTALAPGNRAKDGNSIRRDRKHVTLLRFVAPDFAR